MSVTGHSSTDGVRAYKQMSEKLKEVSSDVLNQGGEAATLPKKQKLDGEGKGNLPVNVADSEGKIKLILQSLCGTHFFRSLEGRTKQ